MEYGVAVKCMSYFLRTTQLNEEIRKAIDVDTNPALIEMQEEIMRIQLSIIGKNSKRNFNLNAIWFKEINLQFRRILQMNKI